MDTDALKRKGKLEFPVRKSLSEIYRKMHIIRNRSWYHALIRSFSFGIWLWMISLLVFGSIVYLLPLPPIVRILLLLVQAILILWGIRCGIAISSVKHRTLRDWALRCEELMPTLKHRLVTCVDLATESDSETTFSSNPVAMALLKQTTTHFRAFNPDRLISRIPKVRIFLGIFLPLIVSLSFFLAFPTFCKNLSSSLYNLKIPEGGSLFTLPGKNRVKEIIVTPGDVELPQGESVIIHAEVTMFGSGKLEKPPILHILPEGGEEKSMDMLKRDSSEKPSWMFALHDIAFPLRYEVGADSIHSKTYKISPFLPPSIESVTTEIIWPEYTGKKTETIQGTYIRALRGSLANLRLKASHSLLSARLVPEKGAPEQGRIEDSLAVFDLQASESRSWHAEIIDSANHKNPDPPLIQLHVVDDEAPGVTVTRPGADWSVHRIGEVTLETLVTDDIGIKGIRFEYRLNEREPVSMKLTPDPFEQNAPTQQKITHVLNLEEMNLDVGDVIYYRFQARDGQPDQDKGACYSQPFFLTIRPFTESFYKGGPGAGMDMPQVDEFQIIVATTRLIDMKKGLAPDDFMDQSQTISRGQRAIRLEALRLRDKIKNLKDFPDIAERLNHMDKAVQDMQAAEDLLSTGKPEKALRHENSALRHLLAATAGLPISFNWGAGSLTPSGNSFTMNLSEQKLEIKKDKYELDSPSRLEGETDRKLLEVMRKIKDLSKRQKNFAETIRREKMETSQGGGGAPNVRFEKMRREIEESRFQLERLRDEFKKIDFPDKKKQEDALEKAAKILSALDSAARKRELGEVVSLNVRILEELQELELALNLSRKDFEQKHLLKIKKDLDQLKTSQDELKMQTENADFNNTSSGPVLSAKQKQLTHDARVIASDVQWLQNKSNISMEKSLGKIKDKLSEAVQWMDQSAKQILAGDQSMATRSHLAIERRLRELQELVNTLIKQTGGNRINKLENALESVQSLQNQLKSQDPDSNEGNNGSSGQKGSGGKQSEKKREEQNPNTEQTPQASKTSGSYSPAPTPSEFRFLVKNIREKLREEPLFKPLLDELEELNLQLQVPKNRLDYEAKFYLEISEVLKNLEELLKEQLEMDSQMQRLRQMDGEELTPEYEDMAARYFEALGKIRLEKQKERK